MKRKLEADAENSEAKVPKSVSHFGAAFRKSLRTNNGINALNEFVVASKDRDVVTEYVNAGGNAKELVSLLKQFDGRKDLVVASTVFAALQLVIVKTVDSLLLIQKNVEEACEELLCSYHITLQNMLSSSSSPTSHRKIVLKLFTGMVTLNAALAKKILTLFPINTKLLKMLTDSRATNSATQLRTCFVHYLLSFLIDDHVLLIGEILKTKGLLTSIVPGLISDKPETVILVLNTLKLKIVENVKISKTVKINTFNTPVLRSLAKLYDYERDRSKGQPRDVDLTSSAQSVRTAVHSLLVLLCTSSKKGVLFRERGSVSGKSPNQLIFTLLEDLIDPWRDELKSQLVVEILNVCPEFHNMIYSRMESSVQPSNSENWRELMRFLNQIIEKRELSIECVEERSSVTLVTSSFFPAIVQKLLRDHCDDHILHKSSIVRYHIFSLLEVCLGKISSFVERSSLSQVDQSTVSALKDHVEHFLNKNFVSCMILIDIWNTSIDVTDEDQNLDDTDYYHSLANVLLLYNRLCPVSFRQLQVKGSVNLKKLDFTDDELQFKWAQLTYFLLHPKPHHEQFSSLFRQFIHSCLDDEKETKIRVLESMLLSTGLFEGFEDEISIWLYSIRRIPVEHTTLISDLLVDVFTVSSKEYKNFLADVSSLASGVEETFCENINLATDLEYFVDIDDGLERSVKPIVQISPVVAALLSVMRSYEKSEEKRTQIDSMKIFASRVLVHLLHLQSDSNGLMSLLVKYSCSCSGTLEYLRFWGGKKLKPNSFLYPLSDEEMALQLSLDFVKAECGDQKSPLQDHSDTECILLWNLCTYYAVQLSRKRVPDNGRYGRIKDTLRILLEKLSHESRIRCLKFVICDENFIGAFNLTGEIRSDSLFHLMLDICRDFRKNNSLPSYYPGLLSPYRQKFILFLLTKLRRNERIHFRSENCCIEDVVEFIMLNGKTAASLLDTLAVIPTRLLVSEDKQQLSEWCSVIQNLLHVLAENLKHSVKNESLLSFIFKTKELIAMNMNVDSWETSIVSYLQSFPHHVTAISEEISADLIKCNPSVDQLALHLLAHHPSSGPILIDTISNRGDKMNINDLFEVAKKVAPVCSYERILEIVHTHHFASLMSWVGGECKWEMKYKDLVSEIFQKFAGIDKCSRLCSKIESKWPVRLMNAETCSVMQVIFAIAERSDKLVRLLLSSLTNQLSASDENINWLCTSFCHVIETIDSLNFEAVQDIWENFIKAALKISLRTSNSTLMRTLRLTCDKYLTTSHAVETSTIFQMTISHSEFVNVILGSSELKSELIKFYLLLINKNESLMSSNHIPLLLGGYNALLSKSDQLLLQVLQKYEENKISFSNCKPYLWGDAAVSHHSIRTEVSVALKRQPQANQVLELLDVNIVKNTIRYAPLDRGLRPEKETPPPDVDVYDFSFMLPLMSHLLAPESRVSVQKFTRSGALALVLVALSSQKPDVRIAAFHCLHRFQLHLNSREKEIQLWDHFIKALRNGILTIRADDDDADDDEPPILPCIVSNFLAHMSWIISEPLHSLYGPVSNFLLAKPSFDVNTIPNFLALFYSTDLKTRDHQEWILRIIRDGMRSEQDWVIAQRCFLFKLLLQYYSSPSSNEATNLLILEIITASLKIPGCKNYLVAKFGLLSWLDQIIQVGSDFNQHFQSCLVQIFQSLMKNSAIMLTYGFGTLSMNGL